jgi:hypothetical protein
LIITASIINDFSRFNFLENSSRILNRRWFRTLANLESEKIFTNIQNVDVDFDDNENDERFDCVKCCRIFLNCRRVTSVTCAHCARQKIICVLIRFRFVFWRFFFNCFKFQFVLNKSFINWLMRASRFMSTSCRSKFFVENEKR